MDTGTLIASIVGVLGVLLAGAGLYKQIKTTTAADRDRAAAGVHGQIVEVRAEERQTCADRIKQRDDRIAELVSDRDAERTRADRLQDLINERGLGGQR